jgi:hypothetical protein
MKAFAFADRTRRDTATFPRLAVSMVMARTGIDVTTHTRAASLRLSGAGRQRSLAHITNIPSRRWADQA